MNHISHKFECVTYGGDMNVSLECLDCSAVIIDFNRPDVDE